MNMEKTTYVQKCIIYDAKEKKVLILKKNDKWDFVGGVVEFGAESEDSVLNFAREQAGLILKSTKSVDMYSHSFSNSEWIIFGLYFSDDFLFLKNNEIFCLFHDICIKL